MPHIDLTPHAKTLTQRKKLAQSVRRRLDSYRNQATQEANRSAIYDLLEAEAMIQQLLALETRRTYGDLHATAQSVMTTYKEKWTHV